jgi:hypothetical protein
VRVALPLHKGGGNETAITRPSFSISDAIPDEVALAFSGVTPQRKAAL